MHLVYAYGCVWILRYRIVRIISKGRHLNILASYDDMKILCTQFELILRIKSHLKLISLISLNFNLFVRYNMQEKNICLYKSKILMILKNSEKNDLGIKISFIAYLYIIQITYKIFSQLKFRYSGDFL